MNTTISLSRFGRGRNQDVDIHIQAAHLLESLRGEAFVSPRAILFLRFTDGRMSSNFRAISSLTDLVGYFMDYSQTCAFAVIHFKVLYIFGGKASPS